MKNILARGGIEFIAVLLGITLSLWVDENRVTNNAKKEFQADLLAIYNELTDDLKVIDEAMSFNQEMIVKMDHLLLVMENSKIDVNAVDTIPIFNTSMENRSFFGKKTAYLSSKASGRLNRNSSNKLTQEITRLYDQTYTRMEVNNALVDRMMFDDDKSKIYSGHITRSFIYDRQSFYESVNSAEFYNWGSNIKNLLLHLIDIMTVTKNHIIKVESRLKEELLSLSLLEQQ